MKLVSWNVNGLNAAVRNGLLDFLKQKNADVYCFQEIKADLSKIPKEIMSYPNYYVYPFPAERKGYSGTMVMSKIKPLSVVCLIELPQSQPAPPIVLYHCCVPVESVFIR